MNRLLPFAVMVLAFAHAKAVTYYVSHDGSGTNNGTSSSTPWKTIDGMNQARFGLLPRHAQGSEVRWFDAPS